MPTAVLFSRVIADVDQFRGRPADGIYPAVLPAWWTILITLIFMLTIHPLIALVVVALTPLSLLVAPFYRKTYLCHVPAAVGDPGGAGRL